METDTHQIETTTPWWFFAPLFIAPVLLFLPALLPGRSLFWGITSIQFVPWHWEALRLIRAGELPLWNNWNGMGAPLAANYQSALFYPPTWLTLLAGWIGGIQWMAWSHGLLIVLHLIWAGWGMQKLIKSLGFSPFPQLICGLAYGLCGYLVARGSFLTMVQAASWIPWILLAANHFVATVDQTPINERAFHRIVLLALAFSGQWLSGHAQLDWYTFLFCVAWLFYWAFLRGRWKGVAQIVLPVGLSGLLAFLLCAVQFLPTAEYFLQSQRSAVIDYQTALSYSFWPWRVITLLFPNIFGNPGMGDYWGYASFWEDAIYIGLLPIFFCLFALVPREKRDQTISLEQYSSLKRFSLVSILVVTLLALGWNTPVFPFLFANIPTFGAFNGPTRWMILVEVCLIFLAGIGTEIWVKHSIFSRKWVNLGITAVIAMLLSSITALIFLPTIKSSFKTGVMSTGFLMVGYFLLAKLKPGTPFQKKLFYWRYGFVLWLVFDLLWAGYWLNPSVPFSFYSAVPIANADEGRLFVHTELERELRFERFFTFDDIRPTDDWNNLINTHLPNSNMLTGTSMLNNFDPMVPARFSGFLAEVDGSSGQTQDRYLALSSVTRKAELTGNDLKQIVWKELDALPNVRVVYCAEEASDETGALNWLRQSAISNHLTNKITIEGRVTADTSCDINQMARPEIIRKKAAANRQIFHVIGNPQTGWFFVSNTWYPGWKAFVDGMRVEIYRADYVFMSIPIPEGDHTVEFVYQPESFSIGLILTLAGLITIIIISISAKIRSGGRF